MKSRHASLLSLGALGLAGFPAQAFDDDLNALEPAIGVYLGWSLGAEGGLYYGIDASVFLADNDRCFGPEDGFFSRIGVQLGAKGFAPELQAYFGGGYETWGETYPNSLAGLAALSLHFDDQSSADFSVGAVTQLGPTDWRATFGIIREEARVQMGFISPRAVEHCDVTFGRPLRVDGKRAPLPQLQGTGTQDPMGMDWVRAAQEEWSSVAAFGCVQAQLLQHGAPRTLTQRYEQAMIDETLHAMGAGTLAAKTVGQSLHLGSPLTAEPDLNVDLASIAVAAFWDGCIGEGVAALEASEQALNKEGATKRYLEAVASEEAEHAELAWNTIEWVLERGDAATETLLREALELTPQSNGTAAQAARYAEVLQDSKARLQSLL